MHNTTRYPNGHSDIIGVALVMNDQGLYDKLQFLQNAAGGVPDPLIVSWFFVESKPLLSGWSGMREMR